MPIMSPQGISEAASLACGERLVESSPMASNRFATASCVLKSLAKSSKDIPATYASIRAIYSRILPTQPASPLIEHHHIPFRLFLHDGFQTSSEFDAASKEGG